MKTLTWQKPGQQNVAQELIKIIINYVAELRKYNKYAAARHAARNGESTKKETKTTGIDKEMLKEALRPKFGKSLGRSAVAQRLASSPKSAALRKTSKNNPLNKAKRAAARNKPKGE